MIRIEYDFYCKKCGAGAMKPRESYLVRINGNYCDSRGCDGELGTYEEWQQARREAVGVAALEARIEALENRVAELEKGKRK